MKKITLMILVIAMLPACKNTSRENGKATIAVSILPQEYFVSKIAGDLLEINVMIPPGASPATYEPSPAQLASLSKTDLYLKMGYTGFEMAWMEKIKSVNKNMKVVDLSDGVDLIYENSMHESPNEAKEEGHHHGGIDPHIWLSPKNARIIASNIYKALAEKYPENSEIFTRNLKVFNNELDSLDRYITAQFSDMSSKAFFTYHPSLSYFARDYNLEQNPLELGGKTPSAAHMKKLVDIGKAHQIGVVFLQMQFDQRNAEVLAKEIGAEIVQINPLDPEWYSQMFFITDKLKENLHE